MNKNIIICKFLILFVFFNSNLFSQYNSARIAILSGGVVNFNFKTIQDYKNGIESNNTVIGISMSDINPGFPIGHSIVDGFKLYFSTTASNIIGDAGNTIPLSAIQASASNISGFAGATFNAYQDLTGPITLNSSASPPLGNVLMEYDDVGIPLPSGVFSINTNANKIRIYFQCGMNSAPSNKLLGSTADYYSVPIELWLWPQCNSVDCP